MTPKSLLLIFAIAMGASCGGNGTSFNSTANIANTGSTPKESPTPSETVDELAVGRQLYSAACAACHRQDGTGGKITIEGQTIDPENLISEKVKKVSDDKIIDVIYNGLEDDGMPAFKDRLKEAEIRELVRYLRSGLQKLPPSNSAETSR